MRMVDLIYKKRHNVELTKEEIEWMINGYTNKEIPDYQMSAFLMVATGEVVDLSAIEGIKVDKHSTGGVGDKTSLILGPLVASVGVPVAKMSGRGLGHTGGTLDKLESISGMRIELEMEEFIKQVNDKKIAIIGQTGNLAPADKYLYALRDVTSTVESIPLIASSIMSKKIAAGADAIVLDVKFGAGAFMKTLEDAKELAQAMVEIGRDAHRQTVAFLTDMNQPLGFAIGNALEVKEAIDTLSGHGPKDLEELVLQLASHMVVLAKKANTTDEAYQTLKENLHNGIALQKFKEFVEAQGGDVRQIEDPSLLPSAKTIVAVKANRAGYIEKIDALSIGIAAMKLGAGRAMKEDIIDMGVGVVLNKKVGEMVEVGDTLAYIHSNSSEHQEAIDYIMQAYQISTEEVCSPTLIYDIIK